MGVCPFDLEVDLPLLCWHCPHEFKLKGETLKDTKIASSSLRSLHSERHIWFYYVWNRWRISYPWLVLLKSLIQKISLMQACNRPKFCWQIMQFCWRLWMDALGSWWLATLVLKASTTAVQEFNFRYSVTVTQNFPHHNVLKKTKDVSFEFLHQNN